MIVEFTEEEYNEYLQYKKRKTKKVEKSKSEIAVEDIDAAQWLIAKEQLEKIFPEKYLGNIRFFRYEKGAKIDKKNSFAYVISGSYVLKDFEDKVLSFKHENSLIGSFKLSSFLRKNDINFGETLTAICYETTIIADLEIVSYEMMQDLCSDIKFLQSIILDLSRISQANNIRAGLLNSASNKRLCLAAYILIAMKNGIDIEDSIWIPNAPKIQENFDWKHPSEVRRILMDFCKMGYLGEMYDENSRKYSYQILDIDALKKLTGLDDRKISYLEDVICP